MGRRGSTARTAPPLPCQHCPVPTGCLRSAQVATGEISGRGGGQRASPARQITHSLQAPGDHQRASSRPPTQVAAGDKQGHDTAPGWAAATRGEPGAAQHLPVSNLDTKPAGFLLGKKPQVAPRCFPLMKLLWAQATASPKGRTGTAASCNSRDTGYWQPAHGCATTWQSFPPLLTT